MRTNEKLKLCTLAHDRDDGHKLWLAVVGCCVCIDKTSNLKIREQQTFGDTARKLAETIRNLQACTDKPVAIKWFYYTYILHAANDHEQQPVI